MKVYMTILAIAASSVGFATQANAQSEATATATATLITPISITKTADLNFGTVASSNTAGTVVLDYANVPTQTGGVTLPDNSAASTASFTVTGQGTNSFSVSVPSTITLTAATGGATLTVDDITADSGASTALATGTKTINVKATLKVPADATAGVYTNTTALKVTVNYN